MPALSTPRMAKQVLAKQKRLAARPNATTSSSLQGVFTSKYTGNKGTGRNKKKGRGSFGALGAWMQERELRDEYGSDGEGEGRDRRRTPEGPVGSKKKAEDEDVYMTLPELQRVLLESTQGSRPSTQPTAQEEGGEGFTPFTPPSSSKRRDRQRRRSRRSRGQTSFPHSRNNDDTIAAALEMDVDPDLEGEDGQGGMDEEAMKRFVGGMLGKEAGVHVSMGDLEDEERMREEDNERMQRGESDESGESVQSNVGEELFSVGFVRNTHQLQQLHHRRARLSTHAKPIPYPVNTPLNSFRVLANGDVGVVDAEQLSGLSVAPFPSLDNIDVEDATVTRTVH
ncbi:hypothetical protein NMY22_g19899 [Coprinellus aureogranulatus]|nr:hypothetical protein NMY22_g19899 [Coprinellus aureogranulatus]